MTAWLGVVQIAGWCGASRPNFRTCEETGWSPGGVADGYADARECEKKG